MDYANQRPPFNNHQPNYNNGPAGDVNRLHNGSHDQSYNQPHQQPNMGLKSSGVPPNYSQGPSINYQQQPPPPTNNYQQNTNLRSGGQPNFTNGPPQQSGYAPRQSFTPPPTGLNSSLNNSYNQPPTMRSQSLHNSANNSQRNSPLPGQAAPPVQPSYQSAFTPTSTLSNQQYGYNNQVPPPPLSGQQNYTQSGQQKLTGPPQYTNQNVSKPPPLPGQQFPNQQSTSGHVLQGGGYTGQTSSAPPLPGQQFGQNMGSVQASSGQQFAAQNIGPPPLPGQQYTPPTSSIQPLNNQQYKSGAPPPLPGQQITSQGGAINSGPPLPGQQYNAQNVNPPPLPGQNYQGQPAQAPPLPGQPYSGTNVQNPPPLPGQSFQQQPQVNQPQPNQAINRQPGPPGPPGPNNFPNITNQMGNMNINEASRPINIMQESRLLPRVKPSENPLHFETNADHGLLIPPKRRNCRPSLLRCTLKAVPQTQNLLNKVKLPFGLVIHPFKDLSSLPVISAGTIVRCKRCRTYINPFVSFLDARRWRCNMCFAVNDTPEEFLHHPVSKTYGEPHTRPECTNATIEFIAPQEYMLRPPQPAVYMFLMDVSHSAIESGYLQIVCDALLDSLDQLPGDARARIGFLTYNGTVHFYRLNEGLSQPQMIVVSDIDDMFVPTPENLLVNLKEGKTLIQDLLHQLPIIHNVETVEEVDTFSALGPALEVAKIMMSSFGGRVTVFQHSIPSAGPGTLKPREDPNNRSRDAPPASLNPATDFYKKMALDCSAHQVAVDFFFFNAQYVDIATLSCASRFSAGDLHYYPNLHVQHNPMEAERLSRDLERYLQRKIGFEAVMRIRCTKGLAVHTFHGNFFVRSTDLLSLANVNPDSGYAVNLSIEESLTELTAVCFQAALLYTTSKGERRIRVHTMCVPVVKTPAEVLQSVDCVAVVALLAKMGVDRAITATLPDARDAILNACVDPIKAYKETLPQSMTTSGVFVPKCLKLFPLYIHCLLKHPAFRSGISTKLDERVFSMINFKMQPAAYLMQDIHPDLYRVDNLDTVELSKVGDREVPQPDLLPLSSESLSQSGCFLLDCGWKFLLLVGRQTNQSFINDVLDSPQFSNIEDPMYSVPELENPASELFHSFVDWLQDIRPHFAPIRVIRDDSRERHLFFSKLLQDRTESSMSLQEFLIHIQQKLS